MSDEKPPMLRDLIGCQPDIADLDAERHAELAALRRDKARWDYMEPREIEFEWAYPGVWEIWRTELDGQRTRLGSGDTKRAAIDAAMWQEHE